MNQMNWEPGIGDPTFMGWLTVFFYAAAAVYSIMVFNKGSFIFESHQKKQKNLWLTGGVLLILLCINKQLDLQTLLTDIGRYLFTTLEINEYKRAFQKFFIICILMTSFIFSIVMLKIYYGTLKNHIIALTGFAFLMTFVLIRASSFHHMDTLISSSIAGLKLNWILELTGIFMIIANALMLLRRQRVIEKQDYNGQFTE